MLFIISVSKPGFWIPQTLCCGYVTLTQSSCHSPLSRVTDELNVSVDFPPLKENRNNVANWPDWTVTAESNARDKPRVYYEFHFNQFDGELTYFSTSNEKPRGDS